MALPTACGRRGAPSAAKQDGGGDRCGVLVIEGHDRRRLQHDRPREPASRPCTSWHPTCRQSVDFLAKVRRQGAVRCCYEAGPCGFELQRALTADGVSCDVIAPALIPRRAGDRIKTDRRDAIQLAVLYRAGALTRIHIPTDQEEPSADPHGVPARRGSGTGPARRGRDRSAGLPHARADRHAGTSSPLLPRHRRSDGLDHRRRAERSAPFSDRPQRDGLRGARAVGAFERRQARPWRDHENGQGSSPPGRGRSGWRTVIIRSWAARCANGSTDNRRRSVSRRGRRNTGFISAIGGSPGGARRSSMS